MICKTIGAMKEPSLVHIQTQPGFELGWCFQNVRSHVSKHGGSIVFGWSISEWPGIFIEAEHHAVWEPPIGRPLIDVTPSGLPGISATLFLEDELATYDFGNEASRRRNRRVALRDDPLITEFIRAAERLDDFMNKLPGIGEIEVTPTEAIELAGINEEIQILQLRLEMKYAKKHEPCPCGSGKEFLKCHWRS